MKGLGTMMSKEQRLIDELRMKEELYGNDMLDDEHCFSITAK